MMAMVRDNMQRLLCRYSAGLYWLLSTVSPTDDQRGNLILWDCGLLHEHKNSI